MKICVVGLGKNVPSAIRREIRSERKLGLIDKHTKIRVETHPLRKKEKAHIFVKDIFLDRGLRNLIFILEVASRKNNLSFEVRNSHGTKSIDIKPDNVPFDGFAVKVIKKI